MLFESWRLVPTRVSEQALTGAWQGGLEVCITVTLVDGLVLARSGFHHSMNYRSAMAFGVAEPVTDDTEKDRVLGAMVDHIMPGRNAQVQLAAVLCFVQAHSQQ